MRHPLRTVSLTLVAALAFADAANAQLRGGDRDEAKRMVYNQIYLRTDVPTNDDVEPFIEISPTGYSWERLVGLAEENAKRRGKPSGVYWPFRPNDTVKWGSPKYDGTTITVWFEGQRDELKVRFVGIRTLDDFKSAFDHVFSRTPLQDEPSWPTDVRTAITERRVIEGMTRQQASCVVGTPLRIETGPSGETIWYARQETGDTRDGRAATTGLPAKLVFVADVLTTIQR